jgi:signal transduction histidine kinase
MGPLRMSVPPHDPGRRFLLDRWENEGDAIVARVSGALSLEGEIVHAVLVQLFDHVRSPHQEPIRRAARELFRAERAHAMSAPPSAVHVALAEALRAALESQPTSVVVDALVVLASAFDMFSSFHAELAHMAAQQASDRKAAELERALRSVSTAQQTLLQQARLKAMGSLADGVAHDVNNSLNAVLLRSTLLGRQVDAKAKAHLDAIEAVVRHAASTVQRLQEFARRRENPSRAACDPVTVVREAIELTRPHWTNRAEIDGGTLSVQVAAPEGVPAVRAEAAELRAVLLDLLLNATEAIPRDGSIDVSIRTAGNVVEIEVQDSGPGIAAEHLVRIFEPFFTTRGPRSSGLGLAMAWGVIDRIGGEIRAANRAEGGATFLLTLPCVSSVAERPALVPALASARTILLVDDDADSRDALEQILVLRGHAVEVASDGREALALYDPERHDAVLCDVTMPNMNGLQLARAIRARNPDALLALLTGWSADVADEERGVVDATFRKPIDIQALSRFLSRGERPVLVRAGGG